ncbi:protein kil [Salmonella enterica]|nr:protein kil [Salmonella enterica]EBB2089389.1 protein kil [Salmonella enterica]EBH6522288.1 protein kil [Salmonella enterica]ECS6789009.1 protein kil [Salmonella enterica]
MTITPVNGTILVQQGNREFNKLYEKVFPDTKQGMSDAYTWAAGIALGWDKWQEEDWGKLHVA